jgi:alkyl sulfatase BDS1-like metallo-beta-lactamase superfamily hydrolase
VHGVRSDPALAKLPYLHEVYDHPQFIVRNLLRLWGGWWNGNAADLLPATLAAQAKEIAALAGGTAALAHRARALLKEKNFVLASHLAEWAARAAPDDREAQTLKRDVYYERLAVEPNLMAQGIFRAAMNDARAALGEEPIARAGLTAL